LKVHSKLPKVHRDIIKAIRWLNPRKYPLLFFLKFGTGVGGFSFFKNIINHIQDEQNWGSELQ